MEPITSLRTIPDEELLRRLSGLARESRRIEAELVAHIAEVDRRQLYLEQASPSMFVYCTRTLGLTEAEAYLRIAAARASRAYPRLLPMLADGRLHLSGIERLAPKLTAENQHILLERAAYKTKRQIEELLADLEPKPDAPPVIRRLPERPPVVPVALSLDGRPRTSPAPADPTAVSPPELRPDGPRPSPAASHPRPAVAPLGAARFKVQFTATGELRDKLERLRG